VLSSTSFIEVVKLFADFELHFEITVNYRQMDAVIEFVDRVGDLPMVLDHCGKPGIRKQEIARYTHDIYALAVCPNLLCQVSGLAIEANQLLPFHGG
jgi:L-fuconolactonase